MSQENKIKYNAKHVAFVFDTDNVNAVLVTEDGNVYKTDNKGTSFCKDHCRRLKIKFETLTREDFAKANPKKEDVKPVVLSKLKKADLLEICSKMEIEPEEGATNADLVKLIEAAQSETEGTAEGTGTEVPGTEGNESDNTGE